MVFESSTMDPGDLPKYYIIQEKWIVYGQRDHQLSPEQDPWGTVHLLTCKHLIFCIS